MNYLKDNRLEIGNNRNEKSTKHLLLTARTFCLRILWEVLKEVRLYLR